MTDFKENYLWTYNVIQATGWNYCLYLVVAPFINNYTRESAAYVYTSASHYLSLYQGIAFLEVIHAFAGLAGGSPLAALLQWAGRCNVLFALSQSEAAQKYEATAVLFAAWILSEVIRYPWAMGQAKKENPPWLTWLRYTAFIPLYPAGFISEALIIYKAIPDIKSTQILSVKLPNALNFGFDYSTLLWGLLLLYPFLSIYMFSYMLTQRKRKLKDVSLFGKSDKADKKKDAGAEGSKGEDVAEVTTRGAREAAATRRRIRT